MHGAPYFEVKKSTDRYKNRYNKSFPKWFFDEMRKSWDEWFNLGDEDKPWAAQRIEQKIANLLLSNSC